MNSEDLASRFCVLSARGGGSIDFLAAVTMLNDLQPGAYREIALKLLDVLQTCVSRAIEHDMLSTPDPIAEQLGRAAADTIAEKMADNRANAICGNAPLVDPPTAPAPITSVRSPRQAPPHK